MRIFTVLSALVLLNATTIPAYADDTTLLPGDKGYRHEEMHEHYQKLFDSGRCYCHTGECRPTIFRSEKESPSGIQVMVNGIWVDVPKESILQRSTIPKELWEYPAHVCVYGQGKQLKVECVVINATT